MTPGEKARNAMANPKINSEQSLVQPSLAHQSSPAVPRAAGGKPWSAEEALLSAHDPHTL